ncbi:hypothetical protein BAUCODRAFT_119101 [Baudoinia panamericana UAMH 10762]|uniref:Splicing factor Cactin n=1 Tax=Baudoinia panamericana (strain UAMH 10762) TaxID=717646 RepID=M2MRS8_BAUPA|nr:uncharacterized protein BAUCODRAFT_119101 [Baudoinia panamericana UAMH 10762]EMC99521.1 hypothetical protein BAUCODRAFT_119101 [Baudoinia panamericana UAMH 10762]
MSKSSIPSKRPASDAQEAAWVADEDRFVLQQAKKKAALRVKGGRAAPIDWLAVMLAVVDPERNLLDDEVDVDDIDLKLPETMFDALHEKELIELEKGIETYVALERSRSNLDYWTTMKAICNDRRTQRALSNRSARGVSSIAGDLDKLLGPKTLADLEKLETQVEAKLASNEPIDTDYWEHLLRSLLTYKAKAKMRKLTDRVIESRLESLRNPQAAVSDAGMGKVDHGLHDPQAKPAKSKSRVANSEDGTLDLPPAKRLRSDSENVKDGYDGLFAKRLSDEKERARRQGVIPGRKRLGSASDDGEPALKRQRTTTEGSLQVMGPSSSQAAFDRDLSRGLMDNEELLTTEEPVETKNIHLWPSNVRPRKPRYFARVVTGYEWNKYNQTHYDADNPPPKVVQGYRFNILYPDLADKTRAPTYKIQREGGRRRGEMTAPAGEDDTCVIRFIAGQPYEDIAFRIVDKEWDYSAKRDRGFRSSFDKGILQLHFQFKKIYYRK